MPPSIYPTVTPSDSPPIPTISGDTSPDTLALMVLYAYELGKGRSDLVSAFTINMRIQSGLIAGIELDNVLTTHPDMTDAIRHTYHSDYSHTDNFRR